MFSKNWMDHFSELLDGGNGGPDEVIELRLEGVEHAQGVLKPFGLVPKPLGFVGIGMPDGFAVPRLALRFDLDDEVLVKMRIHGASFQAIPERKAPSLAVALNCGMGSSSLKADVKAFERLHMVRGAKSS